MKISMSLVICLLSVHFCFAQTLDATGPKGNANPGRTHRMSDSSNPTPKDPNVYIPPSMQPIPEGQYEMGAHGVTGGDATPVHAVHVDSFLMDTYETTNKQYALYLNEAMSRGEIKIVHGNVLKMSTGIIYCKTALGSSHSRITWDGAAFGYKEEKGNHPVVYVTWYGAVAYANWRSEQEGLAPCYNLATWECNFNADGFRLPTEAEWEYACRGGFHNPYYIFPWGDWWANWASNCYNSQDPFDYPAPAPNTTPVGYYDGNQYPAGPDMANGYGLYDMSGNAWEWVNDWYDENYYSVSPYDNPTGPATGTDKVLRGGSWLWDWGTCSVRVYWDVDELKNTFGFRLVREDV